MRVSTTASRAETANPGGAPRSHEEATKWVEEKVKTVSEQEFSVHLMLILSNTNGLSRCPLLCGFLTVYHDFW